MKGITLVQFIEHFRKANKKPEGTKLILAIFHSSVDFGLKGNPKSWQKASTTLSLTLEGQMIVVPGEVEIRPSTNF